MFLFNANPTRIHRLDRGTYIVTMQVSGVAEQSPNSHCEPARARLLRLLRTTIACALTGLAVACGDDTAAPQQPTTGGLAVTITGLPRGAAAGVTVSGPAGFSRALTASDTLIGLEPGTYTVAATAVLAAQQTYAATPDTQAVSVPAGSATQAAVTYTLVTGDLAVTPSGLPAGVNAALTVTGPAGFSRSLTGADTLVGIPAGTYAVTAADTVVGGQRYAPDSTTVAVVVTAGTLAEVIVAYSQATGSLAVTITGLPTGAAAGVTVSGPAGFSRALTASDTLIGLEPGTYTVAATAVNLTGDQYTPDSASQDVLVSAAQVASVAVTYSFAGTVTLNLRIGGLYAVQSTQRFAGTVPLIQNRDAYLRIFALANEANAIQPLVRVRLFDGGSVFDTLSISTAPSQVPTTVDEAVLASSWNVLIPGSVIQPGLSILADVDPGDAILETDETDNQFPVSGTPVQLNVRPTPTLALRFVPVLQSATGDTGRVDLASADQFLDQTRLMFPLAAYDVDVRSVYTTSEVAQSNGAGWATILNELTTLRNVTDESSRHYYGVLQTSYTTGVQGLAWTPFTPSAEHLIAVGLDDPGLRSGIMAHELGHNFGRKHAECGGGANVDGNYPYANSSIGVFGLDMDSATVKAPSDFKDIMSNCSPKWVSDYTFEGILDFRNALPAPASVARLSPVQGLLVWGRITPDSIVLEPAFEILAAPVLPKRAGPYRLEAFAADGASIFGYSFAGAIVADLPGGPETHFSFLIPLADAGGRRPATLRISGPGVQATRSSAVIPRGPTMLQRAALSATAVNERQVRVEWNAATYPMVMVRDPDSGEVLSFARGGSVNISTRRRDLSLVFSDGLSSLTASVRVAGR